MSEELSTRAKAALERLRSRKVRLVNGWYVIGAMENVGKRTIEELKRVPELEWRGSEWVRFRKEPPVAVGDDRVVVLLAEILAVLRDRL